MKTFSAAEAAAELGVDGKTLRRLVRAAKAFANAGSGGRYTFTSADMPALREIVSSHTDKPKGSRAKGVSLIEDLPGLPVRVARTDPAAVRKITEERVNRLEAALLATGKHISQMRDRDGWVNMTPEKASA